MAKDFYQILGLKRDAELTWRRRKKRRSVCVGFGARGGLTFSLPSKKVRRCPCGFLLGHPKDVSSLIKNLECEENQGACTCTAPQIRRYLSRISGPLLDRIDIHIEMAVAPTSKSRRSGETSAKVKKRVCAARERQKNRSGKVLNARLKGKALREACPLSEETQNVLSAAAEQFSLSRSLLDSLLRVSRTIADLDGCDGVESHHVEEAINYRSFAKKIFS